ncbi:MAG: maleylpyruvate isomerase family mycothiol-dependent enzyme, partial [Actinomycetota bacterium]
MPADHTAAAPTDVRLVDLLEEVWARIAELTADLGEAEWKLPTELPGWSVQDNLTHLTDIEAMTLGRPRPDRMPPAGLAHVRNEPGERNEAFVDARRSWSGADARAEFLEVTGARLAQLRALDAAGFGAESWTPMGPGTVRDLLPFRAFDAWVHEQDMRAALARPGGVAGPAAEAAMDRIFGTAGYVVGKVVAPPDGTVVVIECTPPLARTVAVGVEGGRARVLDTVPPDPTVRIRVPGDRYARLACGRADPAAA